MQRRKFLAASAAIATVPSFYIGAAESANEKLNVGIIGSGGRGRSNLGGVAGARQNIYALCDIYDGPINAAAKKFPDAKRYYDWRELVADPAIDAVVVSTADHHHALASIAAMRAGKHVYCEKPLAHTVREARAMQDEYAKVKGKVATQMGTQIHATNNYRRVVELVKAGAVGSVKEVHVWCSRGIRGVDQAVLPAAEKPADFNWDVWLGPAPMREYNPGYWKGGNLNWNRRWEFGNGVLGDMGSHLIDLPFWALDLHRPTSVVSEGSEADPIACPPWQMVTWEHPARGERDALKLVWYHGGEGMKRKSARLQPLVGKDTNLSKWGNGICFVGSEGVLTADYGKKVLSPSAKFKDFKAPAATIEKSLGHYKEWIAAAKGGKESLCNFNYSGALIEHNLLGNVAHRVGKKLEWNAETLTATPDAARFIDKTYRDGWGII
jgi:predicted dehydrogenase